MSAISSLLPSHDGNRRVVLKTAALIAVALAAITLGALAFAKVGELAKVGTLGASLLCGGGVVVGFLAVAYCVYNWTYSGIPTFDQFIRRDENLKSILKNQTHVDLRIDYLFIADYDHDTNVISQKNLTFEEAREIFNDLRKTYDTFKTKPNAKAEADVTLTTLLGTYRCKL